MTSVAVNIHNALTKKGDNHTSDSVSRLIAEAQAELARVAETVAEDERLLADILTPEDQEAAIEQRLNASRLLHARLSGAMPRLEALRDQITLRERDAAQKAWRQRLVKRRDVIGKQLAEWLDTLPAVANALHEAVQLAQEAQHFNVKLPASVLVNPKDRMVSDYEFLPPIVADFVLNNTKLVSADGTVLFSPVDARAGSNANPAPRPRIVEPNLTAEEEESLQYAIEMREGAKRRLQAFQQTAAVQGVSVEQVASWQGMNQGGLKDLQDTAAGYKVLEAKTALVSADRAVTEQSKTTTS